MYNKSAVPLVSRFASRALFFWFPLLTWFVPAQILLNAFSSSELSAARSPPQFCTGYAQLGAANARNISCFFSGFPFVKDDLTSKDPPLARQSGICSDTRSLELLMPASSGFFFHCCKLYSAHVWLSSVRYLTTLLGYFRAQMRKHKYLVLVVVVVVFTYNGSLSITVRLTAFKLDWTHTNCF